MVMLKLSNHGIDGLTYWDSNDAFVVNSRMYYANFTDEGEAVVYVQPDSNNNYSVIYPAKLYDRLGRQFTLPFAQFYNPQNNGGAYLPARGVANNQGVIEFSTDCIVAKVTIMGNATLRSLRLENKGEEALAGKFSANKIESLNNEDAINNIGVTLNCYERSEASLSSAGTPFYFALPKGNYSQGMTLRVSDTNNRFQEYDINPFQSESGKVVELGTFTYQPDQNILYANHFDNMTWGGDIVGEKRGFGLGSTTADMAPADSKGSEMALQIKEPAISGSVLFDKNNYNLAAIGYIQAKDAASLAVTKEYLENRGITDWWCLFYGSEYCGYIGGGDTNITNRGLLALPHLKKEDIGNSGRVEISFDLAMLKGADCNLRLRIIEGILEKMTIDGTEVDAQQATSPYLAVGGSNGSGTHPYIIIDSKKFGDNKWHKITLRIGAISPGSHFSFYPISVRDCNNRFFVDNVVIRKINYNYNDVVHVAPTTELGAVGEDISKMRLQVGSTGSNLSVTATQLDNLYLYSKAYGHTYISPGFGSVDQKNPTAFDDEQWLAIAKNSKKVYDAAGVKVWCMHLPYGYQGASTYGDYFNICSPDESKRQTAVALLKRIVAAASPLQARWLLIHCNQHLLYPTTQEGIQAEIEAMAKSLYELQLYAESKGSSSIVVENMSWGVGSKASELVAAVDMANAMTTNGALKREVRIAMDTGHATAAMSYANRNGKVTDANIVEWIKTVGPRLGATHIQGNRGANTSVATYSYSVIHDDHMFPTVEGYKAAYPSSYVNDGSSTCAAGKTYYYDINARNNLWGEFYKAMLKDCRYRGVFDYESSGLPVKTVKDIEGMYFKRQICPKSMARINYNFDYYIYDEFRKLN
jgi:hexosaminidase